MSTTLSPGRWDRNARSWGVIQNEYDAAAVSDDKLQNLLSAGDVQKVAIQVDLSI